MTTVDSLSTVDKVTTVDNLATVDGLNISARPLEPKFYRPATLLQHGHTPGEHTLYLALWNQGGPPDRRDDFRKVSIGCDKLAAILGGSKRNVQRLIENLQHKMAIEVIQEEDSGARRGKTYKAYA